MKSSRVGIIVSGLLVCLLSSLAAGTPKSASGILTWSVTIKPAGGGVVTYAVSNPVASGTLTKSGKLQACEGALIDLTFTPNDNYKLSAVYKNLDNWTEFLDASNHYQFGPVSTAHSILAIYEIIVPEGDQEVDFPDDPPPTLTPVYDVSGNYTGNTKNRRAYDLDAAVDEGGKMMVVGTVTGVVSDETGADLQAPGDVKTVKGVPVVSGRGKFTGTLDGAPSTADGKASAPVALENVEGVFARKGTLWGEGTLNYKAKQDGMVYKDKNVPIKKEATQSEADNLNGDKKWKITISTREVQVQVGKKLVTKVLASGVVTLPNDTITFAEFKTRYTPKNGYTLVFRNGTNKNGLVDKKTKVTVKKMTMTRNGDTWDITGGNIEYMMLGQKGKGSILDFITN